jgi:predicted negative regulator of RcsB-dependent stress response
MNKIFLSVILISGICFAQFEDNNKFMLAQSYIQVAQYEKAKTLLEELHKSQPGNYEYFQALNDVYSQLKSYDASIALIEGRMSISNPDINLYGLLGTAYYLKGDENKAFDTWDKGLEQFPQSEVGYRVIANYAMERRAFEKAIQYLKKGQEIAVNPLYFAFDLANLYTITMQYKDAAEEYCLILVRSNEQLNIVENKILSYVSKPGALQATIPVIAKYSKESQIAFKFLLARLYVQDKSFDKAYELYKEINEIQKAQGVSLLNFAQLMYGDQNYKISSEVFNDIINKYPDSPIISMAKLGYAKALEALMDEENSAKVSSWKPFYKNEVGKSANEGKIITAYLDIIKIYPLSETANEASLRIGELKLKEKDLTEAEKYFQNLVADSQLSQYAPDAYLDLAKVSMLKGDMDGAASDYLKIITNNRFPAEKKNLAAYRLARIYFFKGEFGKAKEYLGGILDNLANNSANDALSLSFLMNTSENDSSNLVTFAQAELLAEQDNFKEAAKKYQIVASEPQKLMLQNLADFREAEMELADNNIDSASAKFKGISDDGNKNIYADKALYLLGKIFQYSYNDKSRAVETYENLLAKFPNSLYLDDARAEIVKLKNKSFDKIE